ncbi:MAG: HlyD family efflux transporter periplasmic adaptor subunit [Ardenticatenaceae bacterium]|nr:HlyD family efflux transporter periplasmic adaptor subunit [Anaerolineales bacterium]MCB8922860.1 HlyD family efflux transporter periplasmic adaptor subunit [Ardenticatenaceae bacterium]MCB9005439.1 HlyD family efflux transporter periplasmic adaptor subunit [Ardenticatenaceae bacterium]
MKKSLFLMLLLFLLVGCGQGTVVEGPGSATAVADPNATATPRPTTLPAGGTMVLADGQIVAVNPVLPLSFEANGRLLQLNVHVGDYVAAGDVVATLDDSALQEAVTSAELQVAQAENSLAQAQLSLDDLMAWEADETAVALAEANLAAAQAGYEDAQASDAAAGNSLTSARVNLDQAQRQVDDAQEAYDTAFDPGREWELNDPWRKPALEAERDGATRNLQYAQENLSVARSQYNLAVVGLNNDTAVSANASVLSAQQALEQATTGPKASEIAAARLSVTQAQISLEQAQFSLQQAQSALDNSQLVAPWNGTILSVDVAVGATVGAATPIVTLLDSDHLQFHTSNLSERDLAQMQAGQPAEIVLKTFSTQPLQGTVVGIVPQATGTVGDAAVFTVMIDLEPTDLPLRPGMTGRVEIMDES